MDDLISEFTDMVASMIDDMEHTVNVDQYERLYQLLNQVLEELEILER